MTDSIIRGTGGEGDSDTAYESEPQLLRSLSLICLQRLASAAEEEKRQLAQRTGICDCLDRYKLWAANIGALHSGMYL